MKRLLLIDSSSSYRELWTSFFEDHGLQAVATRSGEAGLKRLREDGPFDLLILDLHLDSMDGIEVLERIQAEAVCPVLVVAERRASGIDLLSPAEALGAAKAVARPLATEGLLREVAALLGSPLLPSPRRARERRTTPAAS